MGRFAIFYGGAHYPHGGWADFKGTADSVEAAKDKLLDAQLDGRFDWWQVVDLASGEIVHQGGS